jgi:uncharacterized damage-inducible protein DinB
MTRTIVNQINELLDNQRIFIKNVENLTEDQINWSPKSDGNSIGIIIDHLIGSEKMLIKKVIFEMNVLRNREKEFEKSPRSKNLLIKSYYDNSNDTRELLSTRLTDSNLLEERMKGDTKKTVLWALLHLLEHSNYHIGQIYLILGLLRKSGAIF